MALRLGSHPEQKTAVGNRVGSNPTLFNKHFLIFERFKLGTWKQDHM